MMIKEVYIEIGDFVILREDKKWNDIESEYSSRVTVGVFEIEDEY